MNDRQTIAFKHLVERGFSSDAYETGHAPYDAFIAAALRWEGSVRALEEVAGSNPAAIAAHVPLIAQFEHEDGESIGLALCINAYVMPNNTLGWSDWQSGSSMHGLDAYFHHFAIALPHARIDARNCCALLNEIPEALHRDDMRTFETVFFNSFPNDVPSELRDTLETFLEGFFENVVMTSSELPELIARHARLWTHLGNDLMQLHFYRMRQQMLDLIEKRTRRLHSRLGASYRQIAAQAVPRMLSLPQSARSEFQSRVAAASPGERGELVADACRVILASDNGDPWLYAVESVQMRDFQLRLDDLIAPLRMPMELTAEQAVTILQYMAQYCSRYASNRATFEYRLANALAQALPVGRADLERLVKLTDYETDQSTKDVLIDALRGKRRSVAARVLRRAFPRLFKTHDLPEMWEDWIADKRRELLHELETRPSLGVSGTMEKNYGDWQIMRGQAYDLDVVGYAKRIALAQSSGARIDGWFDDLRALCSLIESNRDALADAVAADVRSPNADRPEGRAPGPAGEGDCPSLFGIRGEPDAKTLLACEDATLAALSKLIARIDLCKRHSDLATFEQLVCDRTRMRYIKDENQSIFEWNIDQATQGGIPSALLERLDGFDYELLGGPYIEDTEPAFTEYEFEAWRACIHSLARLSAGRAGPGLEKVALKVFGAELDPERNDYAYAPKGFGQDKLADAVMRTLRAIPDGVGIPTIRRLQERARTARLKDRFAYLETLAS
ncbi:hypothetical protein CHX26_09485 [Porphyrobacter sp. HT-58-2]|uniref:hypothetical protein n=1 Tax=Porphyrobacter sp. HT-58-2 TaxID=2023229 RepID=UPI000CDBC790|nr:hypothetical protein [Porphyrobacter sp. HT-58-2]AUX69698.1 hypothetical protein CHX26_09485 [Porphyrobacter sp. HT-58-2]